MQRVCALRRVLCLGLCVFGLAAPLAVGGPKLFVASPSVDLGKVKEDVRVEHKFLVENHGDAVLEIKQIRATCTCVVPKALESEQRRIAPGQSLELPVTMNTRNRDGKVGAQVIVKSNDPQEPTVYLRMTVTVEAVCSIAPHLLHLDNIRRGETSTKYVDLMPGKKNATLELLELKSSMPGLEVVTEKHTVPALNKTGVRVKVKIGESMPYGHVGVQLRGRVKVGDETKEIQIPVGGEVVGDIVVRPPFITQMKPTKRGTSLGTITVFASKGSTVKVKAAVARSDLVETEVREQATDKNYRVDMKLSERAPGGVFTTSIDIFTNSADRPVVTVPLFVLVDESVQIMPSWVCLGGPEERGKKRTITLRSQDGSPLKVEQVTCDDPDISTRVVPGADRKDVTHVEVFVKTDARRGDHYSLVKIKTNIPGAETLTVPVLAVGEAAKKASTE